MEQLTELTRLVFKLPEVGVIFSKAHIDDSMYKQDPKDAAFQFIKVLDFLQTPTLQYFEEI